MSFMFALVFDEGRWELQTEGEHAGERVIKRRKVSKAVAAKRVEHNMIDKARGGRGLTRYNDIECVQPPPPPPLLLSPPPCMSDAMPLCHLSRFV